MDKNVIMSKRRREKLLCRTYMIWVGIWEGMQSLDRTKIFPFSLYSTSPWPPLKYRKVSSLGERSLRKELNNRNDLCLKERKGESDEKLCLCNRIGGYK